MARTLRDPYGVGLSDLGGAVTWGEARILIEGAASDPSTILGAELAGWAYVATMPQLLSLAAQAGKSAMKLMPWAMDNPRRREKDQATPDEIAAAEAELEAEFVFH